MSKRIQSVIAVLWITSSVWAVGPVKNAHVEAELVSEHLAIAAGGETTLGLRMKMDGHWHTYWKNPGDAGIPTKIRWELPEGFEAGPIQWPFPETFKLGEMIGYGYGDEIVLPVRIKVPNAIETNRVKMVAKAAWLACEELCVMGQANLELELPVTSEKPAVDPRWEALFAAARQRIPRAPSHDQIHAHWTGNAEDKITLEVSGLEEGELTFYPSENDTIDYLAPQLLERSKKRMVLRLTPSRHQKIAMFSVEINAKDDLENDVIPDALRHVFENHGVPLSDDAKVSPDPASEAFRIADPKRAFMATQVGNTLNIHRRLRGALVVQLADRSEALAVDVPVREPGARQSATSSSLPLAMFYAVLGGLLLNLMPCVFPVLSIKILGFVQQAGEHRAKIRMHGLSFAFGVLLSFWILTVVLLALRAGGEQLGWGFQLQSPKFVAVMALVMFAVGLNLAGVFEIGLGVMTLAGQSASRIEAGSYAGSLLSGVLATAVATPCTAPFMGPAIGFALTLSPFQTLVVFTALGIGMALPYLVLSMFPGWLKWLPKPGPWMETFKQVMAFAMFGAVIWLIWVFGQQLDGANGILFLLMGMLALAAAAWVFGRWDTPSRQRPTRWVARGVSVVLACVAMALPAWAAHWLTHPSGLLWEPFSEQRVTELRSEGRTVFVDFTADWCLSCKFNEGTVLASDRIHKMFSSFNVALLKADWTLRDEKIAQVLTKFGRPSVPLYVVYSPNQSVEPIVLPTLLTPSIVVDAINQAVSTGNVSIGLNNKASPLPIGPSSANIGQLNPQ